MQDVLQHTPVLSYQVHHHSPYAWVASCLQLKKQCHLASNCNITWIYIGKLSCYLKLIFLYLLLYMVIRHLNFRHDIKYNFNSIFFLYLFFFNLYSKDRAKINPNAFPPITTGDNFLIMIIYICIYIYIYISILGKNGDGVTKREDMAAKAKVLYCPK